MVNLSPSIILNDFEPIPDPCRSISAYAINVSPSGQITLNAHLLHELQKETEHLSFRFLVKKGDKSMLLLSTAGPANYSFSPKGTRKDITFSRSLVDAGISLPARYLVSRNSSLNAWVGVLAERSTDDDPLVAILKTRSGKRRNAS